MAKKVRGDNMKIPRNKLKMFWYHYTMILADQIYEKESDIFRAPEETPLDAARRTVQRMKKETDPLVDRRIANLALFCSYRGEIT
jgi:hypothetical protein